MIPADLQDYARVNLTKFIGKIKNFQNEDDQRKAYNNYIDLLGFEKELKSTLVEVCTYLTITMYRINERQEMRKKT